MSSCLCCTDDSRTPPPAVSNTYKLGIRTDTEVTFSELSPPLPNGWFNWIIPLIKLPDATVLRHCSLDGFFFLRYLKVLGIICLVGLCLTWPILLPLHGTGGSGLTELDLLTMGNVLNEAKFYAHVVVAYCFFGK